MSRSRKSNDSFEGIWIVACEEKAGNNGNANLVRHILKKQETRERTEAQSSTKTRRPRRGNVFHLLDLIEY